MRRVLAAAVVALGVALPGHALAACAPSWAQYGGGTAHLRAATCDTHFEHGLVHTWKADMQGVLEMPPAVAGGVAYTAQDSGRVSAVRVTDGRTLWAENLHTMFSDTPAVWAAGGLMFVESRPHGTHPGRGLYALRLSDGSVAWHAADWGNGEASPIVFHVPGGYRVVAVNSVGQMAEWRAGTGVKVWQRYIGAVGMQPSLVPAVATNPDDCVAPPQVGGGGSGPASYSSKFTGAPALHGGVIYAASYGGDVWAVTWRGRVVWHHRYGGLSAYGSPATTSAAMFLTSRNGYTFRLTFGGRQVWRARTGSVVYSSPAVADGHVYVASYDGRFWRLNAATGAVQWTHNTGQAENTSPVVVGHRVYFGVHGRCASKHGSMVAYSTGSMRAVWSFADGRYSPVVPAGDRLLLVGFGTLYCVRPR